MRIPGSNFRWMSSAAGAIERHVARAFHTELTGDFELVVGRDVDALRQFASIIRRDACSTPWPSRWCWAWAAAC